MNLLDPAADDYCLLRAIFDLWTDVALWLCEETKRRCTGVEFIPPLCNIPVVTAILYTVGYERLGN
jgi:hypothetical protein